MGRKSFKESNEETQAMDLVAQSAESQTARKQEINDRFLEKGEIYSLNACLEKARIYQEQMANGMIGLGTQILLLKVNEAHGNFMAAIEELGLSYRSAKYAMDAALKFGKLQTSATLESLGNAKIRALTVLDEDTVQTLDEGGEIDGIGTFDDVARMTVRELKKALRDLRAERKAQEEKHAKQVEALEEVVRKKESTISELEMEVAGRQPPTKEQVAENLLAELRVPIMRELAAANESVRQCIRIIDQAENINGVAQDQLTSFSEQCSELFSLLDDNYQNFCQAMEYITPGKPEA